MLHEKGKVTARLSTSNRTLSRCSPGATPSSLAQQSRFSQSTHPLLYITELERQAQEAQDKESANEVQQEVAAPKRSFRMAKDDKTYDCSLEPPARAKNGLFYRL